MKRSTMASLISCLTMVLAACSDDATSAPTPTSPRSRPTNALPTVGVGFTQTSDVRTNVGPFHVQSKLDGFDVELKSHDDADIEVSNQTGIPNANGGWHLHPGPVVVLVKTGVATLYDAGDCVAKIYPAGSTFIEGTNPHVLRNDGASNLEIVAVFFVPPGKPRRIEADQPANCPF
jgi:quercetin dioxygenase-like cupin family protein